MKKYTAIYQESRSSGSHRIVITCMARIEVGDNESLQDALDRIGIADSTLYLFVGWPALEGEKISDA